MQIRREDVQAPLFADGMFTYINDFRKPTETIDVNLQELRDSRVTSGVLCGKELVPLHVSDSCVGWSV